MNKQILHKVKQLLNGRLFEEALLYLEECKACRNYSGGKCQLYDPLKYAKKLAVGFCPEWSYPSSQKFANNEDGRIKIVFPSIALLCGGAERWLVDLATGLDKTKFCVCIAVELFNACDKHLLEQARNAEFLVFGKKHTKKVCDNADIVVSWCYLPECYAKHKVFCSHGCDHWTDKLVAEYKNSGYIFTAVSEQAAQPWINFNPTIIYNGCDLERLKPRKPKEQMRRRLCVPQDELLIGFISRVVPEKNPLIVAIAAQELRNKGIKAKAIFVGKRERCPEYSDCIYVDKTEEIANYLNALDVFVLPSNSEAFSLAIIEAWLAKIPVVATPVGAIPELEAKFGKMVVRLDTNLTGAILEAVKGEYVENAYNVAIANFTKTQMIKNWERYLEQLR